MTSTGQIQPRSGYRGPGHRRTVRTNARISLHGPKRGCRRSRRSGPWWHGQPRPGKDQGASAMHRSPSLPPMTARPAPDVPCELLTRGHPAASGRAPEGSGTAEVTRYLTEDRDRIAQRMNDIVVRWIFAAGLDLQTALALIGDHSGASKVYHALDELDQAIRDIRDTIFDRNPPGSPRVTAIRHAAGQHPRRQQGPHRATAARPPGTQLSCQRMLRSGCGGFGMPPQLCCVGVAPDPGGVPYRHGRLLTGRSRWHSQPPVPRTVSVCLRL
jgi:hypothetical protein